MIVFDSSALLAFLQGEPGADLVEQGLLRPGASCGAANWSEVAQKVRQGGRSWSSRRSLLLSYDLAVEPVTREDAEHAAQLWKRGSGLPLGDRLCLALGGRLDTEVWTADHAWTGLSRVRQIR